MTSFMLPIYFLSRNHCIGVIECSISSIWPNDNDIIYKLQKTLKVDPSSFYYFIKTISVQLLKSGNFCSFKLSLQKEGLSMFHARERIPYKVNVSKRAHVQYYHVLEVNCYQFYYSNLQLNSCIGLMGCGNTLIRAMNLKYTPL